MLHSSSQNHKKKHTLAVNPIIQTKAHSDRWSARCQSITAITPTLSWKDSSTTACRKITFTKIIPAQNRPHLLPISHLPMQVSRPYHSTPLLVPNNQHY